jgi:type IX secretion system PorP/SprF family membrane protein
MKSKLTLLSVTLFAVFQMNKLFAQDIHFSQYYYAPITLNPAMTGCYKTIQATVQYKQQWAVVNGYSTGGVTLEFKLNQAKWDKKRNLTDIYKKKAMKGLAIGFNVFSDKAGNGSIKQTQATVSLAYHILLTRFSTLSAGIAAGYTQFSINPDDLRWNNQYSLGNYNQNTPSGETFSTKSLSYNDYGAGILYSFGDGETAMATNNQKHFNIGASVSHINEPSMAFYDSGDGKLFRKYTVHANTLIGIENTNFSVGGSFLYMYQNKQQEITPGFLAKYKLKEPANYTGYKKGTSMGIGVFVRAKDSFIPYVMLEMDKFTVAFSYDVNTSGLTAATTGRGGMEIALRFNVGSTFVYQNNK